MNTIKANQIQTGDTVLAINLGANQPRRYRITEILNPAQGFVRLRATQGGKVVTLNLEAETMVAR